MARKGLIAGAFGMSQFEGGAMTISNFGFRPSPNSGTKNVRIYTSKKVSREIVKRWIELARLARNGEVIGIACTLLFIDGITDVIAVGSLRGVRAMVETMRFSPSVERRVSDRRQQHRPTSLEDRRHC